MDASAKIVQEELAARIVELAIENAELKKVHGERLLELQDCNVDRSRMREQIDDLRAKLEGK